MTDIYRVELTDLTPAKKAYLLLKYPSDSKLKVQEGASYLIDKVKLVLNSHKEVVLISTALTVMIEYTMLRADDEDSLSAGSQEAKQVDSYYYGDGQNKQATVEKDE